jgi:hypothetical protein
MREEKHSRCGTCVATSRIKPNDYRNWKERSKVSIGSLLCLSEWRLQMNYFYRWKRRRRANARSAAWLGMKTIVSVATSRAASVAGCVLVSR